MKRSWNIDNPIIHLKWNTKKAEDTYQVNTAGLRVDVSVKVCFEIMKLILKKSSYNLLKLYNNVRTELN